MFLRDYIIVVFLLYFVVFIYLRGTYYGIKRYQLNKSALKKRRKGETFIEWLLYSRFKEEIPKILRYLYYVVLIIHPLCILSGIFVYIVSPLNAEKICRSILRGIYYFDMAWVCVMGILFANPKNDDSEYARWIVKKRGQKPRRKKR